MPPKRKATTSGGAPAKVPGGPRQSKLAKEHNISAQQEAEIREAFSLFAEPMDGEKNGVLPISDLRRSMIALGIPPTPAELAEFVSILDPDDEGFAAYPAFVAICALQLHTRAVQSSAEEQADAVNEAFALFTASGDAKEKTGDDDSSLITLAHLKRIAATLKEDVADDVLCDMILEANGGAGVAAGVDRAAFEAVMQRAGVWR